jgi:uncharacterized membrane protein YdjX (TVP38/TMEM64 family)
MPIRSRWRKLGPLGLLGILWTAVPALGGLYLVARLGSVAEFLASAPTRAFPLWTAFMAICIGCGLLPVYSNTFLCGWVFGFGPGFVSAMLSYSVASVIGYLLARRVSYERVNAVIEEHDAARRVRHALLGEGSRRSLVIVTLFRLSGSPFPVTNLLLASCGVPLKTYLLGTLLGLAPRILVGTFVAATAARTGARDLQALVRDTNHPALLALGVLASLAALALIGHIARSALRRITVEQ